MARDWDDAFSNGAYIPGSEDLPAQWAARAAAFRSALGSRLHEGARYGDGARQTFDLIVPDRPASGLFVFVHGGYWLAFGKSDWTHLAQGALDRGWAVALPQYTLAPDASLPRIVAETARAITTAAVMVNGPIHLAGHSAGGHLAMRMLCADSALPEPVAARIARAVSISGLHDLRPLRKTRMNETLVIDADIARTQSPALLEPVTPARVTAWVGADERPEFLRQARLLTMIWSGLDVEIDLVESPGENHFSVIEGLADPASPLCATIFDAR